LTWAAAGSILLLVAALSLPIAALRERRLDRSKLIKFAVIWLGLFVIVAVLFSGMRL
jgi:hypothetical protein